MCFKTHAHEQPYINVECHIQNNTPIKQRAIVTIDCKLGVIYRDKLTYNAPTEAVNEMLASIMNMAPLKSPTPSWSNLSRRYTRPNITATTCKHVNSNGLAIY